MRFLMAGMLIESEWEREERRETVQCGKTPCVIHCASRSSSFNTELPISFYLGGSDDDTDTDNDNQTSLGSIHSLGPTVFFLIYL
jgi:hypothetical protein